MSKHTSGPWLQYAALSSDFHNIRYVMGSDAEHIASVASGFKHCGPNDFDQDTALANARLIAAAPEMLAALKKAGRELEHPSSPGEAWAIRAAVRQAIAKAEG